MLPRETNGISITKRLLLCLMLCAAGACTTKFERPVLTVSSIELQGGNLFQQSFLVKFQVQNPNKRELPVQALRAELDVGGQRIASGLSNQAFVVPPMGQSEFDMTITANVAAVLLQLANQRTDSIDYELSGSASLDLPFLHEVPFHQTGSFPLKGLH
jgi:LEA14-like dessication related protein